MSVLNMSSSRPSHETELEQITQLAMTLSGQLARVHIDDITKAIAEALQRVAAVTHVDTCQLIEFSELGTVARAHVPMRGREHGRPAATGAGFRGMARRRASRAARWCRSRGRRSSQLGPWRRERAPVNRDVISLLGVPAAVAGQIVCALVLENARITAAMVTTIG